MKRLLATLIVIVCLSFPALGGHVLGSGVWCDCDSPGSHVNGQSTTGISDSHDGTLDNTEQPSTPDYELAWLLLAVVIYLRAKA
jgi:hypothetical protein